MMEKKYRKAVNIAGILIALLALFFIFRSPIFGLLSIVLTIVSFGLLAYSLFNLVGLAEKEK